MQKELKELVKISAYAGSMPELVQGGGGNTSVKLDSDRMAVKASGFRLNQISEITGYVVVDYKKISNYMQKALTSGTGSESECGAVLRENVLDCGPQGLRPSVEAGFHSILKKYVIHTHPVYANILGCCSDGRKLMEIIFQDMPYKCLWVPYVNPGLDLTLRIMYGIDTDSGLSGITPDVIFLENHGLIVTSESCEACIDLHEHVLSRIKKFFGLSERYPEVKLIQVGENSFESNNAYLKEALSSGRLSPELIEENPLYPDQLVYLKGNIGMADQQKKVSLEKGRIVYNTGYQDALALDETLLGCLFVLDTIEAHGLRLKTMSQNAEEFINGWESEKYRKKLMEKA